MILNVAIIGLGEMGKNHARVLCDLDNVNFVAIADSDVEKNKKISAQFNCNIYEDYLLMLENEDLDAVIIAVPTSIHYSVAKTCIERGLHILIEKPICENIDQAKSLISMAELNNTLLLVGHIERYNPAIIELKSRLNADQLGKIFMIHSRRASPYPHRIQDVGVGIDLAIHELDIMRYLTESEVESLHSEILNVTGSDYEDSLFGVLRFKDNILGICDANWITPTKSRMITVTGEKGMFIVNYLTQELIFYENPGNTKAIENSWDFTVKAGKMIQYEIERKEPLRNELESFVNACLTGDSNIFATDGEDGLKALGLTLDLLNKAKS